MGVRRRLRDLLARRLARAARELEAPASSAIVFSPHPDDETLGCGGTILLKRRAGAELRVVFMTDGSSSHAHLVGRDRLRTMRAGEAREATHVLGLSGADVTFLDAPDGELKQARGAVQAQVEELLRLHRPEQVFVPYRLEPPEDHRVTNHIVHAALKATDSRAVVYEYPIWFLEHWPWVPLPRRPTRWPRSLWRSASRTLRLLREFRWSVSLAEVADLKREALARHRSQMERVDGDARWATLADVGGGAFLECFFLEREWFHRPRRA